MNKETNTSKGCAFIHFQNREDGINVLKKYEELNPAASLIAVPQKGVGKKIEKTLIPATSLDKTFFIGGRHITLHPAVSPDDVCISI